ncbi:MAG: hypothetical protein KGJ34_01155 [Patescibacteria group bacterium]|nr:hypothetical protein [Patescibacteria group bacterium]
MPLFFLAGPTEGGGNWHQRMLKLLAERVGDCIVVDPSCYPSGHPLERQKMKGREGMFPRQTDWERYYLHTAAEKWTAGCIIFWLPEESADEPRTDGKPYTMNTSDAIGEWRGRLMFNRCLRVVVGAEPNFPGLSQIARNFEMALGNEFKLYDSMEGVVERAAYFADASHSFETRVRR